MSNGGCFWFRCCTLLLAGQLTAGSVQYQVADLGSNVFRYEFFPVGLGLMQFQDFDVQFDAALFGGLLNGVADSDFRLVAATAG